MDADAGVPTQVAVGDDDVVEEHGVQDYLSVIESPELDSKKTELITAMLRLETRPHVLKVFSLSFSLKEPCGVAKAKKDISMVLPKTGTVW
jgi:hypothetical protein